MKRRYLAAIILLALLLGAGSYMLIRSNGGLARAAPPPRLLSDASWGANERVNDDPGTDWQDEPAIVVDSSGNAYAVWRDHRGFHDDIYFSYRPAGDTWGANERVSYGPEEAPQAGASIAVDSWGNAYAL